jgi:hypothetical protein
MIPGMSQPEPARRLIRNKAVATFALCFTAAPFL